MEKPEIVKHEHRVTFSKRQMEALRWLSQDSVDELMYGGAKGGGKSVFGCNWIYLHAKKIIRDFNLQTVDNPKLIPIIGFMGRKQAVDFTATTLNTWKRVIPPEAYRLATIENSVKIIIIEETVAIQYGGMDDGDTVKKFNSAEFAFYFIDQAEEVSEEDIGMLRGALRLKIKDGETGEVRAPRFKGLLTANPAICWLKPAFITTPQKGTKFVKALPSDNPFLPGNYVEQLRKAYSFKPELLKAYLDGSWDDLDAAFVVIPTRDVELNVGNAQYDKRVTKRITVCDLSGDGDDETVIYDLENTRIAEQEIYSHRSTMDTVGRIQAHAQKNKSNLICIDMVGMGQGAYDRLCEIYGDNENMTVYGFDGRVSPPGLGSPSAAGRGKSLAQRTYRNYKTYAWFKAAEKFAERLCDIPDDSILKSQLASVTWHYTSGEVICLDAKEDLKEKLKHSPDRADAYVMGLDALDRADPVRKLDAYTNDTEKRMSVRPDSL